MKPLKQYKDVLTKDTGNAYSNYNGKGIDYDTRLRYVNFGGIRYWEHGAYDLLSHGKGNPKGRAATSQLLGTTCDKASDISYTLFTPDGIKVKKTQLVGNPVLWRDMEHDMVVNASVYEPVKYACESSPPIPKNRLKVSFPDPQAEKEKWPEIQKWVDWVNAQRNLGGERPTNYGWVAQRYIEDFVNNPKQPVGTLLHGLWMDSLTVPQRLRKEVLKQTAIIREFPWLKTKGVTQ